MRIKIVSDGTPGNTRVVNVETGEQIDNVTAITWDIDAHNGATAHVEFMNVPVDIEADAADLPPPHLPSEE